jgi:hypothetical protein
VSENQRSLQPSFFSAKSVEPPAWKTAREKTIWEVDAERLLVSVHATEEALFLRWQELKDETSHLTEGKEMEAASEDLLSIKIHKLGWPGFPQ